MSYFGSVTQNVLADATNSSVSPGDDVQTVGAIWHNASGGTSTLGVAGIQVSVKADQDLEVYVDQSPDGTNWDITDTFDYHTMNGGDGWTVQAVNSYVRVRAKNVGNASTSYFRLQTALCPIVEAVPRTLDDHGNLKVGVKSLEDGYGFEVENTPTDEMRVVTPYRLVGATFNGTTLDTNFWTDGSSAGGTISQTGGQLLLNPNTTSPNGQAIITSVREGRYVGGSSNKYRAVVRHEDTGEANNKRRWGAFTAIVTNVSGNGAWFELDGTTLYAVTCKAGVISRTASSSWSVNRTVPTITDVQSYEIYWTNSKVWFTIGGDLKHVAEATSSTWSETMTLPARAENVNSSGLQTAHSMNIRVMTIARLGSADTSPAWKYQSGVATAVIAKRGAGRLKRLVINAYANGSTITLYDALTATNPIAAISITATGTGQVLLPVSLEYGLDFYTGLTYSTTNAGTNITLIYE